MERAVPATPSTAPIYDLPTFLATAHPHARTQPRNPAYDWQQWLRNNGKPAPQAQHASSPAAARPAPLGRQAALLLQLDLHMQLPESRQAILRVAKLELAHLWHHQHQQQLQQLQRQQQQQRGQQQQAPDAGAPAQAAVGGGAHGAAPGPQPAGQQQQPGRGGGSSARSVDPVGGGAAASAPAAAAPAAGGAAAAAAPAASAPAAAAAASVRPDAAAAAAAAAADSDDIFAVADRKAQAARDKAREQRLAEQQRQQQWQQQQQERGGGAVAAASAEWDPLGSLPEELQLRVRGAVRAAARRQGLSGRMSAHDSLAQLSEAFEARTQQGWRRADEGADGPPRLPDLQRIFETGEAPRPEEANLAMQVRVPGAGAAAGAPRYWAELPELSHGDTVAAMAAARRQSAAARRAAAAAGSDGSSAFLALQRAAAASSRPSAGPPAPPPTPVLALLMDYLSVKYQDLLHTWDTAARLQEATQQVAAAAERERATLTVQALPLPEGAAAASPSPPGSAPPTAAPPSAASVACFRETLVLDASSGFAGGSHDTSTSLEFDLDRLVASEPGLGGAWGRRFLERLLAAPRGAFEAAQRAGGTAGRRGSMAGRRRSGAAERAAALALAYPESVERSYSARTGTATLSTSRYGSREANRKLLLEHYAALLQAAALAAAQHGGAQAQAQAQAQGQAA